MFGDRTASLLHVAQVRSVIAHGGGNTNHDDVGSGDRIGLLRERQIAGGERLGKRLGADAGNTLFATLECLNSRAVNIQSGNSEPIAGCGAGEG